MPPRSRILDVAGVRIISVDRVAGDCFFQKHGGEGTPEAVPRVDVQGRISTECRGKPGGGLEPPTC